MSTDYRSRINEIVAPIDLERVGDRVLNTRADAKAFLMDVTVVEKRLRLLKSEIGVAKQNIRSDYASKRTNVSQHPWYAKHVGRKQAIHWSATDRDNLQRQERAELAQQDEAIQTIERLLLTCYQVKAQVKEAIQAGALDS